MFLTETYIKLHSFPTENDNTITLPFWDLLGNLNPISYKSKVVRFLTLAPVSLDDVKKCLMGKGMVKISLGSKSNHLEPGGLNFQIVSDGDQWEVQALHTLDHRLNFS